MHIADTNWIKSRFDLNENLENTHCAVAWSMTWFNCVLGGRCVWEEASEARHPVPFHQLARFRGALHPYWHAQVPQKSEELQPPVCRAHCGPL